MGFHNNVNCAGPGALREHFPVSRNLVYLNHAAVAPLVKHAADAMTALATDACEWGSLQYDVWLDAYEGLRVAAAALIGAHRDEIAIVKNTSEGIATVAMGIDWRPGDKVVAFHEEFPSNYYPWKRLEARGVKVEWVSIYHPLDTVDQAARGARLLAVSHVNYLTGHRVDLDALGEICARHGCFFFVDAIQGLGVFPIDVRRSRIHALAADGHKWLLGPEGCGVLYIQKDRMDEIEPVEFGWTNSVSYLDYASRDMTLRSDAGRYECGTLNTISIFGLRASIQFLNAAGVERVSAAVLDLAGRIEAGARAKGYELAAVRTAQSGSGIVSIRHPRVDARLIVKQLRDERIVAAPRQGWVRLSPHFYVSLEEIDRMLAVLP
ncbi:MAG: aminotransferase class V-fold PLP-dependent enzyme [Acidobacteria bacterium]|nr:aminotransferase class V-fold PLP-dependent enzyme [Acidobacteriota bacterium]